MRKCFVVITFLMFPIIAYTQNTSEIDGIWFQSNGTEVTIGKGKIVSGNGNTISGIIISNGLIVDKQTNIVLGRYSFVTRQDLMEPYQKAADSYVKMIRGFDLANKLTFTEYTSDTRSDEEIRNEYFEDLEHGDPQFPLNKAYQNALRLASLADEKRLLRLDGALLEKKP